MLVRVLVSSRCNFWLSRKAVERARELDAAWAFPDHIPLVGEPEHFASDEDDLEQWEDTYALPPEVPRHDPALLQVFDELGSDGMVGGDRGSRAEIHCLTIPDDVTYYVDSYCSEWIAEQHRCWQIGKDSDGLGTDAGHLTFTIDSHFASKGA